MDEKKFHFRFSEKQALHYAQNNSRRIFDEYQLINHVNRCIIDGVVMVYTECTPDKKQYSTWDDTRYLGEGVRYEGGKREVWDLRNKCNL